MGNDYRKPRFDQFPAELARLDQWSAFVRIERPGKKDGKRPFNPKTGYPGKSTDPATWGTLEQAIRAYERGRPAVGPQPRYAGVGFSVARHNRIVVVDLDRCIDPTTGEIAAWALEIVERLNTYTEISPSGTGLRLFLFGNLPPRDRKKGDIEVYDDGRFISVTGHRLADTPATLADCPDELLWLHAKVAKDDKAETPGNGKRPAPSGSAPWLTDDEILAKIRSAKNSAKFERLWRGDTTGYDSPSEAELGLCCMLAFYTPHGGFEQVERIVRQNCPALREKWSKARPGSTYGMKTAEAADRRQKERWEAKQNRPSVAGAARTHNQTHTEFTTEAPSSNPASGSPSPGPGAAAPSNNGAAKPPEPGKTGKSSQADLLVALAQEATLFHTPGGEFYATVKVVAENQEHGLIPSHHETWKIRSGGFRRWLARRLYFFEQKCAGSQAMDDALTTLEGLAEHDGPERETWLRKADCGGTIYLDLGNAAWEAVEITPLGWRVCAPPVPFRRSKGMLPLPMPVRGGTLAALRPFVNVADEGDFRLVLGWLLGALGPHRPYPVLGVHGEQGAAKSTTSRVLRGLVDPNIEELRREPKEPRDLAIAATHRFVLAFDNLSSLPPWFSDDLCCLATGAGFATRKLHTDDEEMIFQAMRPVVLNGIGESGTNSDLLDRGIPFIQPPIDEAHRRPEEEFWGDYHATAPQILGAALDVVSQALARLPHTRPAQLPRMADFARWITAAEPALGWEAESFLALYRLNREEAHEIALEASSVAPFVRDLVEASVAGWSGTAADLLDRLSEAAGELVTHRRGWPATPRALSVLLRRMAPNLRAVGVLVEFDRSHGNRTLNLARVSDGLFSTPAGSGQA